MSLVIIIIIIIVSVAIVLVSIGIFVTVALAISVFINFVAFISSFIVTFVLTLVVAVPRCRWVVAVRIYCLLFACSHFIALSNDIHATPFFSPCLLYFLVNGDASLMVAAIHRNGRPRRTVVVSLSLNGVFH